MKKISLKNREEFTYYLFLYLKNQDKVRFREEFLDLHPTDQNELFIQMSLEKRKRVYEYLTAAEFADIFKGLSLKYQKEVFSELEDMYGLEMLRELPADEITDFFSEIPDHISNYLLEKMEKKEAENIKLLLSYKEDTAGSLMTTEFVTVKPTETVSKIMEQLRREGENAETIYYLYVTNEIGTLNGVISLRELITAPLEESVETLMKEQLITVSPFADQEEVSKVIRDYDLLAVPVTTSDGKIIGIVTVDDIIDVLEEETTEDLGDFAAVKGAVDLEVNSFVATKKRLPWLVLLMFIGMLTAGLISSFEATLAEVAILALFIPLIADMGGNTGTQSLAVVVRGLALDQLDRNKIIQLLKREAGAGIMLGVICGLIVSVIALIIPQGNVLLGIIIGTSLMITILFSTISGTIIPLIVHRFNIDPALASGPFITTINDIIGLLTYFSIATVLLQYL
ncbi:magnesium transporter [Anaerobacillus arseniciselenatis]|uniref:Magnesium transporter MgtE n=1 Tax=Anaerobacillus arseniciselenatis TaxID=85682 RepID=A0A1S2LT97_9BACI|nr:magnesium transporter [Anaerobacillus arseniciselenatis]OIJ14595.1 magnesium transporter [Anaerobacillus arseniciselenatis]